MRGRVGAAAAAAVMIVVAWAMPARSQDQGAAFRQTIETWLATMGARTGAPITVRDEGGALVATLPDVVVAGPDETVRLGTVVVAARGRGRPATLRGGAAARDPYREPRRSRRDHDRRRQHHAGGRSRTNIAHMSEGRLTNLALQNPGDPTRVTIALAELSGGITGRADGLSELARTHTRAGPARRGAEPAAERRHRRAAAHRRPARLPAFSDYEPLHIATESAIASGDPRDLSRAIEQWLVFPFATMPIELSIADFVYGDGGATPAVTVARASFGQTFESLANPDRIQRALCA